MEFFIKFRNKIFFFKLRKIVSTVIVFCLVTTWLFSGWPKIWKNFPPETPSALADLDTFRVTEYYLTTGNFTGTTYDLTLNQDLADNYFVLIKGSRVGDAASNPDNDYARVYEVPGGKGDLPTSGASNVIALSRHVADFNWEGVVTVVECLGDTDTSGFQLLDIAQTSLGSTVVSGADTSSTAWGDINQVVLFGAYNGGGAEFEADAASTDGNAVQTRLYPSSTSTINWARNSSMSLLAATMTTFVVEWGSEWTVQRVNVAGSNYGDGCNATGEYSTGTISSVNRANTWVWGTGNSNGNGIGDSATGTIVTLGDGVTENTTETTVGHCTEYNHTRDFDIYTVTHSGLAADYSFKADGDQNVLDIAVTVDTATSGYRFGWVYNSCNGSGSAHPRDRFWARYTADSTVTISRGYDGQVFPAWVQGVDFSGIAYQPDGPYTSQAHYRWRDDTTDLNTDGGWLKSEDSSTGLVLTKNETSRLRFNVANIGTQAESSARTYQLQWGDRSGYSLCSQISTWTAVGYASDEFDMVGTTHIDPDGETTTSGLLANTEGYTRANGEGRDTSDTTGSIGPLSSSYYTELEYAFQPNDDAVTGRTYCFRLYDTNAGSALDDYNKYPSGRIKSTVVGTTNMEWGTASGVDDDSWTTINFSGVYTTPVFICTVQYANNIGNESDGDADSVVCRVQNTGSTSAQVRLQEPGTLGSSLAQSETVHWLVVESGTYNNDDIKIEAFTYTSSVTDGKTTLYTGQSQAYSQTYTEPVVLGQVMTYNDTNWSVFWAGGSSGANSSSLPSPTALYTGKHVGEDTTTTRSNETIGVVVIEESDGSLGTIDYEAAIHGQTIDRVDDSPNDTYTFNANFTSVPTVGVVSQSGISGGDGPVPQLYSSSPLTTSTINPTIFEDEIVDTEQSGNTEAVAYLVFSGSGSYSSAQVAIDQDTFRFYSNADSVQPGAAMAAENTTISNVATNDIVRLRLALQVGMNDLAATTKAFTLQYGAGSDCSAVSTWTDLDIASGSGIWRGYGNASPADGTTITSSLLNSGTNALESYEEENNSVANPNAITKGARGEWDWVVQNNGADLNTDYCFRMLTIDDEQIEYTRFPQLSTVSVSVSISLSTDGSVAFGYLPLDSTQDTTASGIDDVETVSVDIGPADLDVRSTVFSEGANLWTLNSSNGNNQVKWEFSEDGNYWSSFLVPATLYPLDSNVSQGQTRDLFLRITMPTVSDSDQQYSSTVDIVATSP